MCGVSTGDGKGGGGEGGEKLILIRRAGYAEFVRWWMTHEGRGDEGILTSNSWRNALGDGKFVDETFFKAGMEYFKKSHPDAGKIIVLPIMAEVDSSFQ